VDAAGNLVIADQNNSRIRRVDAATGVITTVAGNGVAGYAGDGGPAASASLAYPHGVAVDAAGNLFVADLNNNRVRKVDAATGVITTVAGNGVPGYAGDGGPAIAAALDSPFGLAADAAGNLFIADTANERVRKVTPEGVHEGDPAAYTFTIRNTSPAGTDPVTVTSVTDTLLGDLTAAARAANDGADIVLAPGASFTFSAASPPLNAGAVTGTVTVGGHDDEGTPATATADHTLTVADVAPAVAVNRALGVATITTAAGTGVPG
jgi:sugar lactone lactonase YvrE